MKLADADLLKLLPEHLSGDAQFQAAGHALCPYLAELAKSIPNLLIYARLGDADPQKFLAPLKRLTEARPGLSPLDMETLESLAWQFHVDFRETAKTRDQLAGMVRNSIQWHRIKGTPASIYEALKLFGFTGINIEEHTAGMPWATYQLGFAEIAEMDDLARIVAICREMQPARCRLWRVYVDDYDFRPGVWSGPIPPNTWSNAWWSYYSGTYFPDIPGLGDNGLMVSFGLKRKFQSEPWLKGNYLAIIWQTLARAFRVKRRHGYIWSDSHWGDLYPMHHGFFGEQRCLYHFADLVCESGTWENPDLDLPPETFWPDLDWESSPWPERPWGNGEGGGWADFPWAKRYFYDRKRPAWAMRVHGICKSQGVWSDVSDKISGWSRLNCNWSCPTAQVVEGPPDIWGQTYWSGEGARVRHVIIREQFLARHSILLETLHPRFDGAAAVGVQIISRHLRYDRAPFWSRAAWSDFFPRRHGFTGSALASFHFAQEISLSHPWDNSGWNDNAWISEIRYDRQLPPWLILPGAIAKSQGVYSDVADKASGWSRLNCNWSVPLAGDEQILEQRLESQALQCIPLAPAISGHNLAAGESHCARRVDSATGPFWSASAWSGKPAPTCGFFGEGCHAAQTGVEFIADTSWHDAPWDEKPWREITGFGQGRQQPATAVSSLGAFRIARDAVSLGSFAIQGIESSERQWDGGWDAMTWEGIIS